jgi:RNA-directed DNA polymerase
VLTSLHHLIDREWMLEAYRLTRKDGAPGIDGMTATDYEANLDANLGDLLARIKSGRYIAPPVRRHYIPKADGTERPLGIPTLEDKVAQRAILLLLEPIYETDFLPCSFGFRPGRSAHDALHALRKDSWSTGYAGWWTSTSRNTSTPSTTRTCADSSISESRTALSEG